MTSLIMRHHVKQLSIQPVEELLRTTDIVLLSYVKMLLQQNSINTLELDGHMSVLEGSISVLIPKRLMVPEDQFDRAVRHLLECDLEDAISPKALKKAGLARP